MLNDGDCALVNVNDYVTPSELNCFDCWLLDKILNGKISLSSFPSITGWITN